MRGERRCCFGFMVTKPDYYIVTFETDRRPFSWRWEIRRHSQPMGVKLGAGGYPSQGAAESAGERALKEFRQADCHGRRSAAPFCKAAQLGVMLRCGTKFDCE